METCLTLTHHLPRLPHRPSMVDIKHLFTYVSVSIVENWAWLKLSLSKAMAQPRSKTLNIPLVAIVAAVAFAIGAASFSFIQSLPQQFASTLKAAYIGKSVHGLDSLPDQAQSISHASYAVLETVSPGREANASTVRDPNPFLLTRRLANRCGLGFSLIAFHPARINIQELVRQAIPRVSRGFSVHHRTGTDAHAHCRCWHKPKLSRGAHMASPFPNKYDMNLIIRWLLILSFQKGTNQRMSFSS